MNEVLKYIEIHSVYFIMILFVVQFVLLAFLMHVNMKYTRLKRNYFLFMRGKDGKNLEQSVLDKFAQVEEIAEQIQKNNEQIKKLQKRMQGQYRKTGIVKYNAFENMEGELSFVLTILDGNNNGWILDSINTGKENYNYLKEIVKGQSYIELTKEEKESLEHAIYQEAYDIRDMENVNQLIKEERG